MGMDVGFYMSTFQFNIAGGAVFLREFIVGWLGCFALGLARVGVVYS
jgi:hypothetical protein